VLFGSAFPLERLLSRKLTLCSFRNDFCIFVEFSALHSLNNDFWAENLRCAPLWTTFLQLRHALHPLRDVFWASPCFSSLHSMVQTQILHITSLGDLALVGLNKNEKLQVMAPLKTFLPSWKENGAIEKMKKKDYIKLYIVPLKLICVLRSGYVVVVHILQSIRTGSWWRYYQKRTFPLQLQLTHCIWVGHSPKHQVPWLDVFQSDFSITPLYCFGLIFIDVLYSLKPGPFYSIFCYLIISFVFYWSCCSYLPCLCFFWNYCFVTK
jgi:hypothetical protein